MKWLAAAAAAAAALAAAAEARASLRLEADGASAGAAAGAEQVEEEGQEEVELATAGRKAAKLFAWVPASNCSAPVKLCYEGNNKQNLLLVTKVDVLNPCQRASSVLSGSCASHGYPRRLGQDPVFRNLTLYLPPKPKPVAALAGVERGVCLKHVSARGVGKVARDCAADEERQLGVCYPRCAAGEDGVGPLCWASCAVPSVSMGPLCCDTTEDCTRLLEEAANLAYDVTKAVVDRESPAEMIDDLKALIADAKGFAMPQCAAT
jgi:hypothetical protein